MPVEVWLPLSRLLLLDLALICNTLTWLPHLLTSALALSYSQSFSSLDLLVLCMRCQDGVFDVLGSDETSILGSP